ncbi:MAG: dihydrodipicolinate synthase family protein, partial [Oscillospiraceae bacterium]
TKVCYEVGLPVILYNVPSRTGMNISVDTYVELAKNPLVIGAKEASGNISQIAEIAARCGDSLPIYSGNDDQIVPILSLGGCGVISVLSNVCPKETHDICELFFNGDVNASRDLQLKLLPLINALFSDVNPIPVKAAMNILGWNAGECRLPLVSMDTNKELALKDIMKKFNCKL